MSAAAASAFLFFLLLALPVLAAPERLVSLSLCTDILVLQLAPRETVASLSYLATDPRYSPVRAQALGLPLNQGRAEEVLALTPDLVLSTQFSASQAVALLRRLGQDVEVLGFPGTVQEGYGQIRAVAGLLQQSAAGEALIASMQADMRAARQALAGSEGTLALFYDSNGYSYGAGTLEHDFLQSLGWRNLAAEAGLQGPGRLGLEDVLRRRPDLVIVDGREEAPLARSLLSHPALRRGLPAQAFVALPRAWFQCAGPSLALAYRALAARATPLGPGEAAP